MAVIYEGLDTSTAAKLAQQYGKEFGLTITSGKRSMSEEMSLSGGSKTSMHLTGQAFDFAGSSSAMKSFASWAKATGLFTEVIDEGNHIHVGWATGKHPDGKTYVGNHTYIDKKGSPGTDTSVDTNTSDSKESLTESIFNNVVKVLLILGFLILGVILLAKTFPVIEDTASNFIPAGKVLKTVKAIKGVKSVNGQN